MTSLTIYCGLPRPIKAIGKHQCKLLEFVYKYRGWHSYASDRNTVRAVQALSKKGCLQVIADQCQFQFPKSEV